MSAPRLTVRARLTALYAAIPLTAAIIVLMIFGPETKAKQLERITAEELHTIKPQLSPVKV